MTPPTGFAMLRHTVTGLSLIVMGAFSVVAQAAEMRIVGSSTVYPFTTSVAEQFGATTRFGTPFVEQTGTGGGVKLFCDGVGLSTPSAANASRKMKGAEWDRCQSNGVTDVLELKIGYDGIVIANGKNGPVFNLTKKQIFQGLAKQVPVRGRLIDNPYKRWSDISPELPDIKIQVFGPPPTSGTRDAFIELAMEKGAEAFPELAQMKEDDPDGFLAVAHAIREDGSWSDSGENDAAIVQTLAKNRSALGVFGFSFLDQNGDRIKGARVNGVEPTYDTISSGDYAVSRSMYVYIKVAHVGVVPGLERFIEEYTSEDAWGPIGYLQEKGLIPLPDAERPRVAAAARALTVMTERPK
jgi:phosphate transport system substrate-binding protein